MLSFRKAWMEIEGTDYPVWIEAHDCVVVWSDHMEKPAKIRAAEEYRVTSQFICYVTA
jgi:hypothetical protein